MHLYLTAAVSQKGNSVEYMLIEKVCVCEYIMCVREHWRTSSIQSTTLQESTDLCAAKQEAPRRLSEFAEKARSNIVYWPGQCHDVPFQRFPLSQHGCTPNYCHALRLASLFVYTALRRLAHGESAALKVSWHNSWMECKHFLIRLRAWLHMWVFKSLYGDIKQGHVWEKQNLQRLCFNRNRRSDGERWGGGCGFWTSTRFKYRRSSLLLYGIGRPNVVRDITS